MKNATVLLFSLLLLSGCNTADHKQSLSMSCEDYRWSDIETLVQPYLDDELYVALVMQGQSSNYSTSAAASQAMNESLPDVIKRILQSLIDAGC
ncbi:MAG: hypothetical protein OQK32_04200 [Gammaproteobacteria bacterium]|nr:hypothetical protein [Gammaproteobacteria bacterium]MCW8924058.1 hypothetical protein [Gammaproteobacteria bacterium]